MTFIIVGRTVPKAFGWIVDPVDTRDALYSTSPMAAAVINNGGEIDNSRFFRPISNQLSLPACVGNASADLMEAAAIIEKVQGGMDLAQAISSTPDLSRMFIWWNGRNEMDPVQTGNAGSGTFNRLAMDVLARHGVCTEARWPYDPTKATTRPSIMAFREAFVHRFDAFYSITETGDDRIRAIIQALGTNHNVLFGTAVAGEFMSYTGGLIGRPGLTASIVGRHAMVICGWSASRQAFKVRNSWTTGWGEAGYCWLSMNYIDWNQTKSLWVPTKGA